MIRPILTALALLLAAGASAGESWKVYARLPFLTGGPLIAVVDGKAYFFGGNKPNGGPNADTLAYDLKRRKWETRRSGPQVIGTTAIAVLDGSVVLAGGCVGYDCSRPTASVRAYDPKTDQWSALPSLPEPMIVGNAAVLGGRYYLFGGQLGPVHSSVASARVYMYDPKAAKWTRLRDMPTPRAQAGGVVRDGRFVILGGCTSQNPGQPCDDVAAGSDEYDPATDSWSPSTPLPLPLRAFGAAADGGRLIVAGGVKAGGVPGHQVAERTTFLLERGAKKWTAGPLLPMRASSPVMFSLPRGVGLVGFDRPDDQIVTLGAPGSYEDARPVEYPAVAEAPKPAAPAVIAEAKTVLSPAPLRPHSHAVVIGIERYRGPLPRADFAASDAREAADYFRLVLGVPSENLAMLTDDQATKGDFEKYFERWLPNRVEPGDDVFVYFSGHGAPNPKSGESYLVPYDADPLYIEQTGYPIARLFSQLAKLKAKRVLIAMDSCFSGAGGRSVIAKGARPLVATIASAVPPPLIVITAATGDQISNTDQEHRHGLFTYYFLEALAAKRGDLRAAFDDLKPKVSRAARREYNSDQEPQWREGK